MPAPYSVLARFLTACDQWTEAQHRELNHPPRLFSGDPNGAERLRVEMLEEGRRIARALGTDRAWLTGRGQWQTRQIEELFVCEFEETDQLYKLFTLAKRIAPSTNETRWLTLLGSAGGFLVRAATFPARDPSASIDSIGYALCVEDVNRISVCELGIDARFRRKGVASAVLAHLKARCLDSAKAEIRIDVGPRQPDLEPFLATAGFRPVVEANRTYYMCSVALSVCK